MWGEQMLASTLWALASMMPLGLEFPDGMVLVLLQRASSLAHDFQQQDISNTLWVPVSWSRVQPVCLFRPVCVFL